MNTVLLIGRLTKDPVLMEGIQGKASYCRFSLAVDRGRNKDGEKEADFPSVVAFGKTAENMSRFVEKGNLLGVEGEVRTGKYEKNGKTIYTEEIIANRVEFLQWKKMSEGEPLPEPGAIPIPGGFTGIDATISEEFTDNDIPF